MLKLLRCDIRQLFSDFTALFSAVRILDSA